MHIYSIVYGTVPAELEPIITHNEREYGLVLVEQPAVEGVTDTIALAEAHTVASDVYRWERAARATEPELYVDLDCKLLTMPDLVESEPNLPYWPLPGDGYTADPQPDSFLMYVPAQFAIDVLEKAQAYCGLDQYCWPRKVLRDWPGIKQIDPSYYEHLMYSTNKRRQLQRAAKAVTNPNPEE